MWLYPHSCSSFTYILIPRHWCICHAKSSCIYKYAHPFIYWKALNSATGSSWFLFSVALRGLVIMWSERSCPHSSLPTLSFTDTVLKIWKCQCTLRIQFLEFEHSSQGESDTNLTLLLLCQFFYMKHIFLFCHEEMFKRDKWGGINILILFY